MIYLAAATAASIFSRRRVDRQLSALGLPDDYLRHRKQAPLVQNLAMILFMSRLLFSTFRTFSQPNVNV